MRWRSRQQRREDAAIERGRRVLEQAFAASALEDAVRDLLDAWDADVIVGVIEAYAEGWREMRTPAAVS